MVLIDDLVAAVSGAIVGVIGQLITDLVTSAITGQWSFSSWEIYMGEFLGGAIGGVATLYVGPVLSTAIGAGVSAFIGLGLENITGTANRSIEDILLQTAISTGIGALTGGLTQFMKISPISKGSHSFGQVYKSGITKALNHGFHISSKTVFKGLIYKTVESASVGWLNKNITQGLINTLYHKYVQPMLYQ